MYSYSSVYVKIPFIFVFICTYMLLLLLVFSSKYFLVEQIYRLKNVSVCEGHIIFKKKTNKKKAKAVR